MKSKAFVAINLISIVLLFLTSCSSNKNATLELWYKQPAHEWEEALPIGNGRLGAMVFGDPAKEHLQFNEETLWNCGPREYQHEGAAKYLPKIRQLLFEGKQAEAEALAGKVFMGTLAYEKDYPQKKAEWLKALSENNLLAESLNPGTDDSRWPAMEIHDKSIWETKGLPDLDGCLVFRKTIEIPESWAGKDLSLNMGKIKDHDISYFNGVKIGETNGYTLNRIYTIPGRLVKAGENKIAVQIINYEGTGGFNAVRSGYKIMNITCQARKKDEPVFIEGEWKYKIVDSDPPVTPQYEASYQPFADLWMTFPEHEKYTNYHRSLDISKALCTTTYTVNGVEYRREYLASNPDQAIVLNLSASKKNKLNFTVGLSTVHSLYSIEKKDENTLAINLRIKDGAMKGTAFIRVDVSGGAVAADSNKLVISDVSSATLKLVAATNFVSYEDVSADPVTRSKSYMDAVSAKDYLQIKSAHSKDYSSLFNRFSIDLGGHEKDALPADERIKGIKTAPDNALAALFIQYSRYLMISSGREGTSPPNLQGIWNKDLFPSWGSKYTTNINCEMNFWGVDALNLSECDNSLFSMMKDLQKEGSKTAKIHYGANGWVLHHNTDQWRGTAPINNANHGIWVTGGAWFCHQLWEHYLYTQDKEWLLTEAWPIIKSSAQFFIDFLVKDPQTGSLISCPSNSPEHGGLVAGPTMDHEIIRSLFKIALKCDSIAGDDPEFNKIVRSKLDSILPYQIGKYGQLQEWKDDIDDPDDHHRHVSHLWGVYPGNEITWDKTPDLMKAALQSLIFRGDEGTGWSLAWKICLWARFLDGDHAHKMVEMLLSPANDPNSDVRGGCYPNLFDAHPPFQIDGNFGGAAGMVEMIMQSHEGYIQLLPALPKQWNTGSIHGLRARGGFEINMDWKNSKVTKLAIKSLAGQPLHLRYNGKDIEQKTAAGKMYRF